MKLIIDGKKFAVSGYQPSDSAPEKCVDWGIDFGLSAGGLPESVDLRGYMTPVEDQSRIGSCTANAVAGAYEYLCKRKAMTEGDEAGDISRLFIYYVARKRDQTRRGTAHLKVEDKGSSISGAIDALTKKGACLEDTYPYDIRNVNMTPTDDMYDEARTFKISGSWRVPTSVDDFKEVLAKGYPIIFGCRLFTSFFESRGRGGPIPMPSNGDKQGDKHGLHAMLMVGYSDSHKVFIVRNSWGENWGYGGYCYMPYAYLGNSELNLGDNWAIRGLTEYDFTPEDEDKGCDLAFDNEAPEPPPMIELAHDDTEDDDQGEEEEDFDEKEFFSDVAEARKVFAVFDEDGSGEIDLSELRDALMLCGQFVDEDFINDILEEHDENDSKTIDFKEFLELMGVEDDAPPEEDEANNERDAQNDCAGGGRGHGYGYGVGGYGVPMRLPHNNTSGNASGPAKDNPDTDGEEPQEETDADEDIDAEKEGTAVEGEEEGTSVETETEEPVLDDEQQEEEDNDAGYEDEDDEPYDVDDEDEGDMLGLGFVGQMATTMVMREGMGMMRRMIRGGGGGIGGKPKNGRAKK